MSVIEKRYWTEGIKEGEKRERERIIKLLEEHKWFEKGEQDTILRILDGTYKCNCGCVKVIKGDK